MMLKRIVMQVSGRLMALFTQVLALLKVLLWKVVSSLRASFTHLYLNVASQLALIAQKLRLYHAAQIKSDMLLKPEPTYAPAELIHHGSQQLKVAAQLQQPVLQAQKQVQRHAERTKSGKFAPKGTGVVAIHTDSQPAAAGTKRKGHANQRRQRATLQRKKGR